MRILRYLVLLMLVLVACSPPNLEAQNTSAAETQGAVCETEVDTAVLDRVWEEHVWDESAQRMVCVSYVRFEGEEEPRRVDEAVLGRFSVGDTVCAVITRRERGNSYQGTTFTVVQGACE